MANTPMQEMFDLNTAIDQLKNEAGKSWNFEVKPGELECQIHIFAQNGNYPEVVQKEFFLFNTQVHELLNAMIDRLVEARDQKTMQILAKQSLPAPKFEEETKPELKEHSGYVDENGNIHVNTRDAELAELSSPKVEEDAKSEPKHYKHIKTVPDEYFECDGLDCDTCLVEDCPKMDKHKEEDI